MSSNLEQHELYENARNRVQQKKRLYYHFVLFLIGSVFLIILNKIFKFGENYIENWFVWVISFWFILLCLHFVNVFFVNRFLGKEWQRKQIEKLVEKQEKKITQLQKTIEKKSSSTKDDEIVL
ncbi:MAG: 2TM domain-containing protein [Lutibacter sp.]|jgi:amino acid permease|uniref:2TM domain-containing protein n=1 Tax=Lutibacter sp. TaxID=1925666 RepID=UPI00299D7CC0|nr:2TM domain-containing protein [Lutibacter sp.]MDX1828718.1 2TM domain-containing protein [Lutibacter sp.]